MTQEKYGVVTDDKTKTADQSVRCPKCGTKIDLAKLAGINVKVCPQCGTKPFEGSPPSSSSSP